jgi:beta-lactamase regulating signal transducer with metallopeptidase domain
METTALKIIEILAWQSFQIAALAMVAAGVCFLLRRSSAQVRYFVWLVILMKCFIPGIIPVPVTIPSSNPRTDILSEVDPTHEILSPETDDHWQVTIIKGAPPMAAASNTTRRPISPAEWIGGFWFMGMGTFLGYVGWKALNLERHLRSNRKPVTCDLARIVAEVAVRFHRKPRVFVVPGISQPFVWGLFRGAIYLPADFELSADFRNYYKVLAHEFAHVVRWDPLANAVQVIAQAVFFFHPMVWMMNRRLRMEREKCCDETAIATLETSPREYGSGIVQVLMQECRHGMKTPTLAAGGSVRTIEERIRAILRPGRQFRAGLGPIAALGVVLFALAVLPMGLVIAEKEQPAAATAAVAQPATEGSETPISQPGSTGTAAAETAPIKDISI